MTTPRWRRWSIVAALATTAALVLPQTAQAASVSAGDSAFTYTGSWTTQAGTPTEHWSSTAGNTASINFTAGANGSTVALRANTNPTNSTESIKIDDAAPVTINVNTSSWRTNVTVWTSGVLAAGPHTMLVTVVSPNGSVVGANLSDGTFGGSGYSPAPPASSTSTSPTAAFTASTLTVALDASASMGGTSTVSSYSWDFGDGQTGSGAKPSHTYAKPGTYTVKLTVTGPSGTTSASQAVAVGSGSASTPGATTTTGSGGTTPAPPSGAVVPAGASGNWALSFDDEFDGTSLDRSRWSSMDGGNMNNVTTRASNVSVGGGVATLTLSDSSNGAEISSSPGDGAGANGYMLPVGSFTEARVQFPGSGSSCYNWPAWWTSGPNWPAAGEHDIAETLGGQLTAGNYHAPNVTNNGPVPSGSWCGGFHTYGLYRAADHADVYWDGTKVRSYSTSDNGEAQSLLLNVGKSGTVYTGTAGALKVDYVRAWAPA